MKEVIKDIDSKIGYLFVDFKYLDTFYKDSKAVSFIAKLREGDNINKMKKVLCSLKSGIEIENIQSTSRRHKFEYKDFEITIYYAPNDSSFDFFYNMSRYCIHSFVGKMVKRFGLKLNLKGLFYEQKLNIDNHHSNVGSFLVTDDAKKLFEFISLDYDKFLKGFKSKEDFFNFLIESPFINTEIFSNPKKEHNFDIFVEFQEFLLLNSIEKKGLIKSFEDIDTFFKEVSFSKNVELLKQKEFRKRTLVKKFNGRVILDYYKDFDKNKIGTSIAYFKHSFGNLENFRDFIFDNDTEAIMKEFKSVVKF